MTPELMRFPGYDGAEMGCTALGAADARPLVLLHGLFSSAAVNWLRYGAAAAVAAAGFRVLMPDFRAHGESRGAGGDFPPDTLAMDVEALAAHLNLADFDLGGYSLGGRTVARLLARGMRPRRAVISGMGLQGLVGGARRTGWFLRMIDGRGGWERGSAEAMAEAFMAQSGGEPEAAKRLLRSQVDTPADVLATLGTPTLVLCGADDRDNGSAAELAAALPRATLREIPGNHMSAVTRPAFGAAIAEWLAAPDV